MCAAATAQRIVKPQPEASWPATALGAVGDIRSEHAYAGQCKPQWGRRWQLARAASGSFSKRSKVSVARADCGLRVCGTTTPPSTTLAFFARQVRQSRSSLAVRFDQAPHSRRDPAPHLRPAWPTTTCTGGPPECRRLRPPGDELSLTTWPRGPRSARPALIRVAPSTRGPHQHHQRRHELRRKSGMIVFSLDMSESSVLQMVRDSRNIQNYEILQDRIRSDTIC